MLTFLVLIRRRELSFIIANVVDAASTTRMMSAMVGKERTQPFKAKCQSKEVVLLVINFIARIRKWDVVEDCE